MARAALPILLIAGTGGAQAGILYVKPGADASNTLPGQNWSTATNLQRALALAVSGDVIHVASGVYYPDEGQGQTDGNRAAAFSLKIGISLLGGFAGTEQTAAERVFPPATPSILSGDIFQDDIDTENDKVTGKRADIVGSNSYHVVKTVRNFSGTIDNFTITGGRADGSNFVDKEGAAIVMEGGSPTIGRCVIVGHQGFSAVVMDNGSAVFKDCHFLNSSANGLEAARVSGMTIQGCTFSGHGSSALRLTLTSATITQCEFTGNATSQDGAGINNNASSPVIAGCRFAGNTAGRFGGGVYNNGSSSPVLTNCLFSGNVAEDGGGMYNDRDDSGRDPVFSKPSLTNCTFVGNYADELAGGMGTNGSSPVTNCIFWANRSRRGINNPDSNLITFSASNPIITHCIIGNSKGSGPLWETGLGVDGGGNSGVDPLFIGTIPPAPTASLAGDFRLAPGSPAIDAGSAAPGSGLTDLAGNPRTTGGSIDIGAYEFTAALEMPAPQLSVVIATVDGKQFPTLIYETASSHEAAYRFTWEESSTGSGWTAATDLVMVSSTVTGGTLRVVQRTSAPLPLPSRNFFRLLIQPR